MRLFSFKKILFIKPLATQFIAIITCLLIATNSIAEPSIITEEEKLDQVALQEIINFESNKLGTTKKKTWWENRKSQIDLYYPHNVHNDVMTEKGDSCFLCHSFNKNTVTNKNDLSALNEINNEPLLAICHSCHVEEKSAPSECSVCHSDKKSIWPEDHNFDYLKHHGIDAEINGQSCEGCHLDLNYCTDCHFNRQSRINNNHPLGYLGRHGIEARNNTTECASCHLPNYCTDCHRSRR